jgi:hypothetical protein
MSATDVIVTFADNRIGRRHDVEPLRVPDIDLHTQAGVDKLTDAIYKLARRYLMSSGYTVDVFSGDNATGYIDGGRFGTFSIEAAS